MRFGWRAALAAATCSLAACLFPALSDLGGAADASSDVAGDASSDVARDAPVIEAGVPDGAFLYLPFEEGAGTSTGDKSGNGFNAVLSASAVDWTQAGKIGNALVFNQSYLDGGGYVDIPSSNTSALNVTTSFSITAWIFATAAPPDDAPIVSNMGGTGFQLDTTIDKGPRTLGLKLGNPADAGGFVARYGATLLQLNQWYFVAGVYDAVAGTLDVYLDGQLDNGIADGVPPNGFAMSTIDVHVGHRPGGYEFYGTIDEVRMFPRPLSAVEISALAAVR